MIGTVCGWTTTSIYRSTVIHQAEKHWSSKWVLGARSMHKLTFSSNKCVILFSFESEAWSGVNAFCILVYIFNQLNWASRFDYIIDTRCLSSLICQMLVKGLKVDHSWTQILATVASVMRNALSPIITSTIKQWVSLPMSQALTITDTACGHTSPQWSDNSFRCIKGRR